MTLDKTVMSCCRTKAEVQAPTLSLTTSRGGGLVREEMQVAGVEVGGAVE